MRAGRRLSTEKLVRRVIRDIFGKAMSDPEAEAEE